MVDENRHIVCPNCNKVNRVPASRLSAGGTCGACKQPLCPDHVPEFTKQAFATHIARIVATVGDAHTTAVLPRHSRLPLECYWFKEGIYITRAVPEFAHLRQKRIVAVQGTPIDEIVSHFFN